MFLANKRLSLLALICSSLVLTACSSTNNTSSNKTTNPKEKAKTTLAKGCEALPFDPKGDASKLQKALQNATNTGKQVQISGTYYIDKEIKVTLRNHLLVDARAATFIATEALDGDLFGLDAHNKNSKKCGHENEIEIHWHGGLMDMADAKVSQVVPIVKMTPEGRTGTKKTADALSIRGNHNGYQKLRHVHIEGISVTGTKNDTDPFFLAGGDSGILMAGTRSAKITKNKFYGIRDAAIYVTAAGKEGEIGDNFVMTHNIIERAYDGITSKRGADKITMQHNTIKDVAVGLSIKHLFSGRTSHDAVISHNTIKNAVRAISIERVTNASITDNIITDLGAIFANSTNPINARGKHYEAIGLDGTQGKIKITNNQISTADRSGTKTYGIVSRAYDGRKTTEYNASNNQFIGLTEDQLYLD
ncbi:right-handed parallel beta-helix repeat-containing protein [Catenovulum maritimum]|uniref:Right handed beta helix domain-containing protein n=1 Tax=Catenovulum maritimum TaxID=1513271 RepID=A0A0J8GVR9_9ALTE|nr:right-handed parallel beta-helix repeat-containing protein [Catenovulum maritimum]KMT66880.1 hypothetical protein XM47_01895 [Catenovulum maritimum]